MILKEESSLVLGEILVIDLEPTPYKTDLWNAVVDAKKAVVSVIYTEDKNPAPDGGHKYQKWPDRRYDHMSLPGVGILGFLNSSMVVMSTIFRKKPDLIYIAGYDRLVCMLAILLSCLLGNRFVVHADVYNTGMPFGRFTLAKFVVRELMRKLVFWKSTSALVCGLEGIESAIKAGCASEKIVDFPYVIDVDRMRSETPKTPPLACQEDINKDALIIMFSGRMIPRKGLETLLSVLPRLKSISRDWVLWIEGDGPELVKYQNLARQLGVIDRCRFLGFCQFDVHGWLMCASDIVVVPSIEDSWGIIVDEGLQLGKLVISSDGVGSGNDRVQSGINGFIFPAGNASKLGNLMEKIIDDDALRLSISELAINRSKTILPRDNAQVLTSMMFASH